MKHVSGCERSGIKEAGGDAGDLNAWWVVADGADKLGVGDEVGLETKHLK